MQKIVTTNDIRKSFAFHINDEEKNIDKYFCKCGAKFIKDNKDGGEINVEIEDDKDINDVYSMLEKATKGVNIKCEECGADYAKKENYSIIQAVNKYFLETFQFVENEELVSIYKFRFSGNHNEKTDAVSITEIESFIALNKKTKKLTFKDFNSNQEEFNLDNVFPVVKNFFNNGEAEISDRLVEVHRFLNRLANFVSDSKNINIVGELLSQMIGKGGIDIITKVVSIFFGIICYPNLSTIALTKGTVFLYDMLNDCNLPNPSELKEENATSPIKIFNFLVSRKNKEIQDELDSYDHNKTGYVFKSKSGKEFNLNFNAGRYDIEESKIDKSKGGVFVREDITDKKVSQYIFNKVTKFSDYKIIIKYLKFISYEELINLVMKNETEVLVNIFPLIEFRDGIDIDRINQFIKLAITFSKTNKNNSKYDYNSVFVRKKFKPITETISKESEDVYDEEIDYEAIKHFDLNIYDDSLRMIQNLNWDPKKEFYKIKHINELETYHNNLVEHYNLLSNEEKNKCFVNFVSKFKHLEEYDGDLSVRLIKTPDILLNAAKDMKNCAASYINRISDGQYLLFLIDDLSNDRSRTEDQRFMFGIHVSKNGGLEFDQVKSACNKQGSDRLKKQVMKYLENKDISYKELADLRLKDRKKETVEEKTVDTQIKP